MTKGQTTHGILKDPTLLVAALMADGWRVIGPKVRDQAIVYEVLDQPDDLPRGLTDSQSGGLYRLEAGQPERWFDYVVGPHSWKKWLFPARQKLWTATRLADAGFEIEVSAIDWPKTVFFGVRACEIAAMTVQDRVFDNGMFRDAAYAARRADTLIVAVQCARSAETCFCASMNTGPGVDEGYDIALTELAGISGEILVTAGSDRGRAILAPLALPSATDGQIAAGPATTAAAAASQSRAMVPDIARVLREGLDHPNWEVVADACLSCGNCTLACPTCFCSDVEDVSDLSGDHAERWRSWDSCFSTDFSYVHGGAVRRSPKSQYRQWMTHKLSTWHDQFEMSGCVGCGRCITWCPVGIDITREAGTFAAHPHPAET